MDLGSLRGGVIWWAVAIALALVMGVVNRRAKQRLGPEKLAVRERDEKARVPSEEILLSPVVDDSMDSVRIARRLLGLGPRALEEVMLVSAETGISSVLMTNPSWASCAYHSTCRWSALIAGRTASRVRPPRLTF
jgi:hypothetical protein